ncbi:MAG: TlpA family protein disulfide reductase [Candidatus Omnitrophica bacterium]|nr:TlpA family protein disulfide reductase [Candidatus Omnitrophota bacterium]MCM8791426.1 TlpA family protein disulfide reductase [Candidatus Omnitrophota bacterium]
MNKRIFFKSLALMLAVFVLSACAPRGLRVADAAPDFRLRDINGNIVQLSDHKGKVIILDFFATWCPPCKMEVPDFVELQRRYGDRGFTIIGVSLSRLGDTQGFVQAFGVNYPVLIADSAVAEAYGPIRSIPVTFVIDKDFNIARKYIGYRPKEVFENDIKQLLK